MILLHRFITRGLNDLYGNIPSSSSHADGKYHFLNEKLIAYVSTSRGRDSSCFMHYFDADGPHGYLTRDNVIIRYDICGLGIYVQCYIGRKNIKQFILRDNIHLKDVMREMATREMATRI